MNIILVGSVSVCSNEGLYMMVGSNGGPSVSGAGRGEALFTAPPQLSLNLCLTSLTNPHHPSLATMPLPLRYTPFPLPFIMSSRTVILYH